MSTVIHDHEVKQNAHSMLSTIYCWRTALVVMIVSFFSILTCQYANAGTIPTTIWGDNFGSSVQEFSLTDGSLLKSFDPATVFNTYWNGRGVVQVGNTLYLTNAFSNNVYTMDATTGAKIGTGIAFSIAGSSGLSAIAYDGTNFWVADYSGTNHAYLYSPSGTLLKTISLDNCTGYCDGLEYFSGQLISNRVDGCCGGTPVAYDVYDLSGNLLTSNLISNPLLSTGIAFDGTDFWTSNIYNSSLSEWNGTTGAFINTLALTGVTNGIEDLSVNYTEVLPPPTVPEPTTIALLGLGLASISFARRRRKAS
ncbi:MAG: PEP-CTERM sorting domain-containing protein [Gallionellaceae bacterium]